MRRLFHKFVKSVDVQRSDSTLPCPTITSHDGELPMSSAASYQRTTGPKVSNLCLEHLPPVLTFAIHSFWWTGTYPIVSAQSQLNGTSLTF